MKGDPSACSDQECEDVAQLKWIMLGTLRVLPKGYFSAQTFSVPKTIERSYLSTFNVNSRSKLAVAPSGAGLFIFDEKNALSCLTANR